MSYSTAPDSFENCLPVMTEAEIEAALQAAFNLCEAAGVPLEMQQKAILLQALARMMRDSHGAIAQSGGQPFAAGEANPLDELTQNQRQALLQFIQDQDTQAHPWKSRLLNDWLQGQDSGAVQFVREELGLQWLERVQPVHLAQYTDQIELKLKVGDRIEVSNSLWEWVQDDGPCCREWYPCTVVTIAEEVSNFADGNGGDAPSISTSCTVRFENGMEYEIQEVYGWNQYQWRWGK